MSGYNRIVTFIRYYRIVEVTILGLAIGAFYGLFLHYLKLSAVTQLVPSIIIASVVGLLISTSVNVLEFLVIRPVIRKIPPLVILPARIIGYSLFSVVWIAISYYLLYRFLENVPPEQIAEKLRSNPHYKIVMIGSVIMTVVGVVFYQISLLQSRNGLLNYLLGRYSKPQRTKKIFLFLDLKSSTTHAENLGDLRFSSLLQDCFFDLVRPVHETAGDVYQYIGDEAVITWDYRDGRRNFRAVQCFMEFRRRLKMRSRYYLDRYGFVPEFKAGLHGGEVVVVRVGEIKKEIAYHGDVLNTTARLEAMCNQLQTSLVISSILFHDINMPENLHFETVPGVQLRGKEHVVELFKWME